MSELKVVVWNCGGLRAAAPTTSQKMLFFEREFKNDFHLAIFVETHQKTDEQPPPEILRYQQTHQIIQESTNVHETHAGITILLHNDYELLHTSAPLPGRILNVQIEHTLLKKQYNVIAVYNHTLNVLTDAKMTNLTTAIKSVTHPAFHNILTGDFNFVEHDKDRANSTNRQDRTMTKVWQREMGDTDFIDPFRYNNPKRKMWSYIPPNKSGCRLDRLYVDEEMVPTVVKYRHFPTPFAGAHRVLSFSLTHDVPKGPGYWKMNTSILSDRAYRGEIDNLLNEMETLGIEDSIDWWQIFIACVRSVSASYSDQKNRVKRELKNTLLKELSGLEEGPLSHNQLQSHDRYQYLLTQLKNLQLAEIEGYKRRSKYVSKYDEPEHDIAFYAKVEVRQAAKNTIPELAESADSKKYADTDNMLKIVTKFYKDLYRTRATDNLIQSTVLKNITTKLSNLQQTDLDADITLGELSKALTEMQAKKSPGMNGVPVEFYQQYWDIIQHQYLAYIQQAKIQGFPNTVNTSATTIFYKDKGETYLLKNYRPISLINTDIKILSKVLSNRLKPVLPDIIHSSQTAVPGRKIDQTVHTLRDLIDISNEEGLQTAFIFLDQEKAFDRVNHDFLFKTMKCFGFGPTFIGWIRTLYANAATLVKLNGFFSEIIALNSGVRQGCPLSALLYVLVIEVLSLQLRLNKNIVGFVVGGERIVSTHYVDDAVIVIKQNRCFKEVYKELKNYQAASAAQINLSKTVGLWSGSWKNNPDTPWGIKWTNKNVFNLGVYFGNDDPARKTFEKLMPKCTSTLHFWKQFKLSQLGKARVVEMFVISQLSYASRFYTLPKKMEEVLQRNICLYINYPKTHALISQQEMWKSTWEGGLKLINVQTKTDAYKIQWLLSLLTRPCLQLNLAIFYRLLGQQIAQVPHDTIFFLPTKFLRDKLTSHSRFYTDSLIAFSQLDFRKAVPDINQEHLFFNPLFTTADDKTFELRKSLANADIFKYGQLHRENFKRITGERYNKQAVKMLDDIHLQPYLPASHILITTESIEIELNNLTHKVIYGDLTNKLYRLHMSQVKWQAKMNDFIDWTKVWKTLHTSLATNRTKTAIWQMLHLNYNTQYVQNLFYKKHDVCPMCKILPIDRFHIIFDCDFTKALWQQMEPLLLRLHALPLSNEEKAFGIIAQPQDDGIRLRNWLTYTLRTLILQTEVTATFKDNTFPDIATFHKLYNHQIRNELIIKKMQHIDKGTLHHYERIITYNNVICSNLQTEDIHDVFAI